MGKDLQGKQLGVGLSQRKDGRYSARFVNQYGKRVEFYDWKLSVVRKLMNDAKYEEEHGLLGDSKKITVDTWFCNWVETYKKDVVSHSTYLNYKKSYTNHIKPHIGTMLLSKIKSIHLQKILNEMYDNEYEYGTMNLVKITMGAVFDGAVNNDYILKNPAKTVKCRQRDVKDRRVLTISEQEEFIKYARHSMYYPAYILALQTGLRAGEIGGLRWSDIDLKDRTIKVQRTLLYDKAKGGFYFGKPKTKSSNRVVPLTDLAIEILNEQKINQFKLRAKSKGWSKDEEHSDLVFTSINGQPTGTATFRNNIIRIVTNINKDRRAVASINKEEFVEFEPMYMHCLRHTFATRCIESDMKPKTLQTILGHSSITITMDSYVHTCENIKHEEIKKLNQTDFLINNHRDSKITGKLEHDISTESNEPIENLQLTNTSSIVNDLVKLQRLIEKEIITKDELDIIKRKLLFNE